MKQVIQMELRKRKTNRLREYDYSQNGAYFITICTKNRAPILSEIVGAATSTPRGILTTPPRGILTMPFEKYHKIIPCK